MIAFRSKEQFRMPGPKPSTVFVVELDQETSDFAHLIGQKVLVDGVAHKVTGVERFTHMPPWLPGEEIGLRVDG